MSAVALRFRVIRFLSAGGCFMVVKVLAIFRSGPPLERSQLAIHAQMEMGQETWCLSSRGSSAAAPIRQEQKTKVSIDR